ncbi:Protein of unknown function [Candidatus Frackibacter sp. WG12]|uniref:DUF2877 domain-containing protein n=1 Tax=Candidatus Frackibacter sp. WG12 TaxID=2017977 RepID=UPI0008AF3100|nr:DUF2877 domain-containing protein [Candidatus Frackibacter sp. WG12]SEM91695.1 Protein of unknown function [Candidatus Frackibacter sp. WG12]
MRLSGLKIGSVFKRELKKGNLTLAKVESVFKKVINLKLTNGKLVSISTSNNLNAPNNLIIASSNRLDLRTFNVKLGEEVELTPKEIFFKEAGLRIGLDRVEVWNGELFNNIDAIRRDKFEKNFSTFAKIVVEEGKMEGVGEISRFLVQMLNGERFRSSFGRVADAAYPNILNLQQAILTHNKDKMIKSSKRLIGLGPGLTPAGDDFLVGFYTILQMVQTTSGVEYIDLEVREKILTAAKEETTLVSKTTLEHILNAEAPEVILQLIEALFLGDAGDVYCYTLQLLARGSTSGTDIATVILSGGYILSKVLEDN